MTYFFLATPVPVDFVLYTMFPVESFYDEVSRWYRTGPHDRLRAMELDHHLVRDLPLAARALTHPISRLQFLVQRA